MMRGGNAVRRTRAIALLAWGCVLGLHASAARASLVPVELFAPGDERATYDTATGLSRGSIST